MRGGAGASRGPRRWETELADEVATLSEMEQPGDREDVLSRTWS